METITLTTKLVQHRSRSQRLKPALRDNTKNRRAPLLYNTLPGQNSAEEFIGESNKNKMQGRQVLICS